LKGNKGEIFKYLKGNDYNEAIKEMWKRRIAKMETPVLCYIYQLLKQFRELLRMKNNHLNDDKKIKDTITEVEECSNLTQIIDTEGKDDYQNFYQKFFEALVY
jgi:hypothetical protein